MLSRGQVVVLVLSLLVIVAGAVRIYLRAQRFADTDPGAAATPTPTATDYTALSRALASTGEERLDRLWQFLSDYPSSEHRELAYTQLLEAGASTTVVCDHAQREDPALFAAGSALHFRCTTP